MDELDLEAFRQAAAREGRSLSDWLRRAARERLEVGSMPLLSTVDELHAFFDACDQHERGTEPEWSQHLSVIERSKSRGQADA